MKLLLKVSMTMALPLVESPHFSQAKPPVRLIGALVKGGNE